ncbi:hypothetical protein BC835DRAFT_1290475 [Cytidiella melzeri]|nr:hypothetical protein BC835DRAFT_1290475 [Cytidiella melzeri]
MSESYSQIATHLHQLFLTDLLLTSPCLRFSDTQISAMLRWAKVLHMRDVPTLYAIKKMRQDLRHLVGDPTKRVVSPSGNIFHINDIGPAVSKVWIVYLAIKFLFDAVLGLHKSFDSICNV